MNITGFEHLNTAQMEQLEKLVEVATPLVKSMQENLAARDFEHLDEKYENLKDIIWEYLDIIKPKQGGLAALVGMSKEEFVRVGAVARMRNFFHETMLYVRGADKRRALGMVDEFYEASNSKYLSSGSTMTAEIGLGYLTRKMLEHKLTWSDIGYSDNDILNLKQRLVQSVAAHFLSNYTDKMGDVMLSHPQAGEAVKAAADKLAEAGLNLSVLGYTDTMQAKFKRRGWLDPKPGNPGSPHPDRPDVGPALG